MTSLGATRLIDEPRSEAGELRSDGERDSDRVLYASAFRRLTGVTQVVSAKDEYVYHDRTMHSIKVAQVAQRLAAEINSRSGNDIEPIDVWVVHAAALAHDLGHPPFGHAGEQELQALLTGVLNRHGDAVGKPQPILEDSFEGNAQTFRIVTRLAARKQQERIDDRVKVGLNLTHRTNAAILKYPWTRGNQPAELAHLDNKWGAYATEAKIMEKAIQATNDIGIFGTRSIEAAIMDWSDDIAYAVHDTEDFFRAKLIPLHRLKGEMPSGVDNKNEWDVFLDYAEPKVREVVERSPGLAWRPDVFTTVAKELRLVFPESPYQGNTESREQLHLFASTSIRKLSRLIEREGVELVIPLEAVVRAELMKKLTRYYVIEKADMLFDQHGQRRVIRDLFFTLWDLVQDAWKDRSNAGANLLQAMPSRLSEYCAEAELEYMNIYGTNEAKLARGVVDFICSLTDKQAEVLHGRLMGRSGSGGLQWATV